MSKKVLIVGGVAGGASAAARLRRNDENAEIIMFERGEYISFANCGLPYYIGNVIEERDALLVETPEEMNKRFKIDVRVNNEVVSIDRDNKKVQVKNLKTGEEYSENYDKLILSPGSSPLKPPIPGIDAPNIFTIWNIPDTDAIKNYVDTKEIKKAAVVGGGFIGLEMAENLHELGYEVSIVELADQVMAPIDYEMAQILHKNIATNGVDLRLNDGVKEFNYKDGVTEITLNSGNKIDADIVILSIGVRPNSKLAKDSGLKINDRGGIIVDSTLKTSDEDIYAVGDVIEVEDFVNGGKTMVPLAGPANKQGRIAANNIVGINDVYKGTQGTSVAKVFDFTVSSTGANEKTLKRLGKKYGEDYLLAYAHNNNHAGYYPGSSKINMKIIFEKEGGKILGVQAVGMDGVEKRVDVIATAMRYDGTVYDLADLELAYAPPYGSAKDPVNMLGFLGENILEGKMDVIQWFELDDLNSDEYTIVDVREAEERDLGYVPNSINISVDDLRDNLDKLDKNKTIVLYCATGIRAYVATRILLQNGFDKVKNLSGGFTTYSDVDFDLKDSPVAGGVSQEEVKTEEVENIDLENVEKATLNCSGLQCPGPIMKVYEKIKTMKDGEYLEVRASDPGFFADIASWCQRTGNTLIKTEKKNKEFVVLLKKGVEVEKEDNGKMQNIMEKTDKSMVVFSGDLDKALASFIIANGAAAMGRKVTMFFTFWGLNVLRKDEKINVKKNFMEKMFGAMMPRGSKKLKLSKMNMGGMGSAMMKKIMKDKNVDSLEALIKQAQNNGVRMVACTMSMDVMGIKEEELLDGIEYAGVATFLSSAENSDASLFI
jgi:NADPH-dependent 2,4-dienoyl-CoA reductase/sulfur reductase-like enzyme/peroxiredoxin family protein/rhodanese-related sulfurtransferase/TusA-related sulfurtransferase